MDITIHAVTKIEHWTSRAKDGSYCVEKLKFYSDDGDMRVLAFTHDDKPIEIIETDK